nr:MULTISPECIES: thiamine phosphate synthase [unclassified Pannonibacter]
MPRLDEALGGGDVACVLIYQPDATSRDLQETAARLVPVIQKAGAAALVYRDTQVAGRTGADGAHVDTGFDDIKLALDSLQPARIVGAGGTKLKHEEMEIAEAGVDYLLFGRLDLEEQAAAHPKTLERAQWWAELFSTPCVALGGNDLSTLDETAATGSDFVALKDAVWHHPDGPAAAVRAANLILDQHPFEEES